MNGQIVQGVTKLAPTAGKVAISALRVITPAAVTIATSPTFPITVAVAGVCAVGIYAIRNC